ncbi:hypothetical protein C900_03792 [Fulvivirga imtechensis AK7]|uniref:DUF3078 domain-containing protein n=1 Tax=Fulvivirga imtechensis AK7 TaxID=1237149 RepID=L8JQF1_9BACT|nr:DUF3078 domain-containing protein [Fulvivirga imtechensis]ELR70438.1 hypothetical protein C900_03792 [Fulvivirga imtechensis AK7]
MKYVLALKRYSILAVLLVIICLHGQLSFGQTTDTSYWKKDFRVGLSFNQASFSDNWQGGGVNSIGLNTFLNYKANYAKGVHSWDNIIDLAYGVLKNEGQSSRKSVDRFFLDTKYGRQLSTRWNFYTSLSFLSQFDKGYQYDVEDPLTGERMDILISNFMLPAFITSSWGLEYKPVDYFKVRLGPFSPRATIVTDEDVAINGEIDGEPARYGVKVGDKVRFEWLAFQLMADFNKDIAPNLNLKWNYILYANYGELEWRKVDHRLDAMLTAKVNNFIDVGLGAILIYDYDQIDEVQLSQALNLGIVYKFKNYVD